MSGAQSALPSISEKRTDNRANIRPAKQLWLPMYVIGELFVSKAESVFSDWEETVTGGYGGAGKPANRTPECKAEWWCSWYRWYDGK